MPSHLFWENSQQAGERLNGTVVLLGDLPVQIQRVQPSADDLSIADILLPSGEVIQRNLADEAFHRFRKLPPLGWTNYRDTAVFLRRRIRRTTRHGLNNDNVVTYHGSTGGDLLPVASPNLMRVFTDKGFEDSCKGSFPTMEEALSRLRQDRFIALSNDTAIGKGQDTYLYYKDRVCGKVLDANTLQLAKRVSYLRESLQMNPQLADKEIVEQ